ncbi:uncharacterized protein LOC124260050 [Haliotis rubra]|uniref:uncharacterized protein LOC124260050 n=1 Tax=Haliotis rubra TaxID=36100 RepID=UPI001EE62E77|nr:uncharacterized protein LOC124260050 [Haliotis rubra]
MGKKARNREARRSIRERARQWASNVARSFLNRCFPCLRNIEEGDGAYYKEKSEDDTTSPKLPPVQEEVAPIPTHHVKTHYLNLKGVFHPSRTTTPGRETVGRVGVGALGTTQLSLPVQTS